jgi:hypothetical protein
MDKSLISKALQASIGSDNILRQEAYTYLESIKSSPGFTRVLMELIYENYSIEISQMSAILIKNLSKNWSEPSWSESDRINIRENLLPFLQPSVPDKIRHQFEEISSNIYKHEIPSEETLSQLQNSLSNEETLYSGLTLLFQICKNYEYSTTKEKREVLSHLSKRFMPTLIMLLEKLLENLQSQIFPYVQIILNTYWVVFYFEVPENLATAESLERWLKCFMKISSDPPLDPLLRGAEAESSPQWICKKWSAQIVYRFFSRFFIKVYLRELNLFICEYFQNNWAGNFFKVYVTSVLNVKNQYLTDSVLNFYLKFITQSIKFEPLVREFRPELIGKIMIQVCLPLLGNKESDLETWNDDPIEFIRKSEDEIKAYYSKKTSATSLILSLCEKGFIVPFFNYLNAELMKLP